MVVAVVAVVRRKGGGEVGLWLGLACGRGCSPGRVHSPCEFICVSVTHRELGIETW